MMFAPRLRNFGMLLFKPVALSARLVREIVGDGTDVFSCMVNDPFVSLNRGSPVEHTQRALLMHSPSELQVVPRNGNSFHATEVNTAATETWEDEGGKSSVREVTGKSGRKRGMTDNALTVKKP